MDDLSPSPPLTAAERFLAAEGRQNRPDTPPADVVERLRTAGCVFAEEEAELLVAAAGSPAELAGLLDRRTAGEPLEHVLGWAEFCGLRISVRPGVFVPRRRTEFLVRRAVGFLRPGSVVLDLCCGSGAVGAALLAREPRVALSAADIDPAAVDCARENLTGRGGLVYTGDLFAPLPRALLGRVDVIVANAPYVPTAAIERMPREARLHETRIALHGGPDGLAVQRRLIAEAPPWLAPGGHLLVETSAAQAAETAVLFTQNGLTAQVAHSTALDATVVSGASGAG
jgi:release factor glutamine methyltransferase